MGDVPGADTPEPRWSGWWAGLEELMSGVPGGFVALKWLGWGEVRVSLPGFGGITGTGELGSRIQDIAMKFSDLEHSPSAHAK